MLATETKTQILMARVVVVIIVAFLVAGVVTYGFSADVRDRVWHDLLERPSHLFRFRFVLQPVMAGLAALHDGIADARNGSHTLLLGACHQAVALAWPPGGTPGGRCDINSARSFARLGHGHDLSTHRAQDILSRGGRHCGNSARVYSVCTVARPNHAVRPLSTRGKARLMNCDEAFV